ncbi:hypothetical protein OAR96_00190 [Euryarchaeota archaeon]|nr:hypothetical protein [Euryarchaeota archaeon]MDC0962520.1 hypothetical protein [Euryarchaeota archaeon]
MSESKSIIIDKETWNQNELLETICSRYFIIGNQSSIGNISWEVNSRDHENISSSLKHLNKHLKPLSLLGLLDEGNPPTLTIIRYPVDPVNVPIWQQVLIWMTMFSFTTLAGGYWISQFEINDSIFTYDLVYQSLIYFSIPIFSVTIIAHIFRKYVASLFEVDVGNLVPIAFPLISPFWPFGIVGVFGQKRVDTITYPNRRSLGLIESSSAVVFLLGGSILSFIGLTLTSDLPPESISDPLLLDLNVIITLLSEIFLDSDISVSLQWLHPLALAGTGLSIIGWILLLPIPGFPGDRILHSIIGPKNLDSNGNETSIFLITLGVMCIVFLGTTFWPWLILASLASWRRFSGDHIPIALVVDEASGIDTKFRNTFAAIIVVLLLLGFPGVNPVKQMSDWDGGLDVSNWDEEILFSNSNDDSMTINLPLEPLGIIPVTGSIQVLIEGVGENWNINSDCFDEKLVCQFEEISQNNRGVLEILISDNNLDIMTPVQLRFIIDSGDTRLEHIMVLKYDGITSPDPLWHRDSELPNEKICIAIEVIENQSGNLSVTENPFWSIEDSSFLTPGNNELCLVSEKGGWESLDLVSSGIQGSRMAPIVTFQQDNGNITTWELPIDNSYIGIYFNQTRGMNLGPQISGILFSDTFGSPFCPSSVIIPTLDSDSEENFTLSSGSPLIINGNYDGRSLLLPETGWLVNCKGNESIAMILKPGFDIDIDDLLLNDSRLPLSDFIINSRSEQNISLVLDISSNIRSDDALNISVPNTILSNSSVNININLDEISDGAWRVFWISQDSDSLILHFVSKCPIGGCLN